MLGAQNPLEQMGFPSPQPPKVYEQRYSEGTVKILATIALAIAVRMANVDYAVGMGAWLAAYTVIVVVLYAMKVPKEFSLGNEIQLAIEHGVAFFIVYLFAHNAVLAFGN